MDREDRVEEDKLLTLPEREVEDAPDREPVEALEDPPVTVRDHQEAAAEPLSKKHRFPEEPLTMTGAACQGEATVTAVAQLELTEHLFNPYLEPSLVDTR